jgi:DNA-binding NarL/FixJ family response regulator
MQTEATPLSQEYLRVGGPAKVVLLADRLLLPTMREVIEAVDGVQLVGAFTSTNDLVDWAMWKHVDWQLAFVDFALRTGNPAEAVNTLLAQPRPGEVIALGAARWPEMQQACSAMGIHRILDRGHLPSFRNFLQEWLVHG